MFIFTSSDLNLPLATPGSPPDASYSESAIWNFDETTKKLTRSLFFVSWQRLQSNVPL